MRTTCSTYFVHMALTTLTIFGEIHILRSSSLFSLLELPATSPFFYPTILFSTLFSDTLSLCSSLNVRTKYHTNTEQEVKLLRNFTFRIINKRVSATKPCLRFLGEPKLILGENKVVLYQVPSCICSLPTFYSSRSASREVSQ
jgi:hypothetical protein